MDGRSVVNESAVRWHKGGATQTGDEARPGVVGVEEEAVDSLRHRGAGAGLPTDEGGAEAPMGVARGILPLKDPRGTEEEEHAAGPGDAVAVRPQPGGRPPDDQGAHQGGPPQGGAEARLVGAEAPQGADQGPPNAGDRPLETETVAAAADRDRLHGEADRRPAETDLLRQNERVRPGGILHHPKMSLQKGTVPRPGGILLPTKRGPAVGVRKAEPIKLHNTYEVLVN